MDEVRAGRILLSDKKAEIQQLLIEQRLTDKEIADTMSKIFYTKVEAEGVEMANAEAARSILVSKGVSAAKANEIISRNTNAKAATNEASSLKLAGAAATNMLGSIGGFVKAHPAISALVVVVGALSLAFNKAEKDIEDAANAVSDATENWEQLKNSLHNNQQTVASISADFEKLSKGVGAGGENIGLTADEFERYNSIANQIADMFPDMVLGYTNQGNAILSCKGNVEELTSALREAEKAYHSVVLSDADTVFKKWNGTWFSNNFRPGETLQGQSEQLDYYKSVLKAIESSDPNAINEIFRSAIRDRNDPFSTDSYGGKKGRALLEQILGDQFTHLLGQGNMGELTAKEKQYIHQKVSAIVSEMDAAFSADEQSMRNLITSHLALSEDFKNLSWDAQANITEFVNNLNYSFYRGFSDDSVMFDWVDEQLLPQLADPKTARKFANAFNFLLEQGIEAAELTKHIDYVDEYGDALEALKRELAKGEEADWLGLIAEDGDNANESVKRLIDLLVELGVIEAPTEEAMYALARSYQKVQESADVAISSIQELTGAALNNTLSNVVEKYKLLDSIQKEIAADGDVSLSSLQGIVEKFSDLDSAVADYHQGLITAHELAQLVAAEYAEAADSYKDSGGDLNIAEMADAAIDLVDVLQEMADKYDFVKSVQEEFASSGMLTASTLVSIKEKFPSMAEDVELFSRGLITVEELLNKLPEAYDNDVENYYQANKAKLDNSEEFCQFVLEDEGILVEELMAHYGDDYENFKTIEDLKLAYAEMTASKLAEVYKGYAGLTLEELKIRRSMLETSINPTKAQEDEYVALDDSIKAIESWYAKLEEAASKAASGYVGNAHKFSSSMSDAAKDAEDAFEKLKEKLNDWFSDMEFQVELKFNAGDIEGTTELYQQMIAKAREALDDAFDMGLTIEDEWIQELIGKINTYKKSLADLRTQEYDKLIEYNDQFDVWNHVSYRKLDVLKDKLADINEQYREGLLTYQDYYDAFMDTAGAIYDINRESLDTLLEEVENALKADNDKQVEALEEQRDRLQDIIDLKKKLLEETRDQEDHERAVAEKVREIAKLQERISQLALDDSREATAERIALEEELYQKQQDLADLQNDYALDATIDALDKQADEYEDAYDKQIDAIKEQIDEETELRQKAIDLINRDYRDMMNDVKGYFAELGYTISDDLLKPLQQGLDLVSQYGSYMGADSGISTNATDGMMSPHTVSSLVSQMKQNASAWHGADKAERQRLNDANEQIGQQLREMGLNVWKDSAKGVWYIKLDGKTQELFKVYHQGGVAGDVPTKKSDEIFALLRKREVILNDDQQTSFLDIIKTAREFVDNMMSMSFGSIADKMKSLSPAVATSGGIGTYSPHIEVNINHNGSMSDTDAKRYGKIAGDSALDHLWETLQKRGIS